MRKRILSCLLGLLVLMGTVLPVYADETGTEVEETVLTISDVEAFLEFAENCRLDAYSENLSVSLESDIDLTGIAFEGIPVFFGIFDGNGHKITGLNISCDGSFRGLFRYLEAGALVRNLSVEGTVSPAGSKNAVGALAGSNEGSIVNCSFDGIVSGSDYVGGLAGHNAVSGIIENCQVAGEIHGNHFVGGVAGENSGVIRNCVNSAAINTTPQQNKVEISDITLKNMTDTEDVNTVTDIGGIAGISSGVIRGSENRADAGYPHMGYNIGGIAGTQNGYIVDCKNYGNIQGRKEVGGIVGQMEPVSLMEYTEDTLQILKGQLETMSGMVNRASGNAQANASGITGQISILKDQTDAARDAVKSLFPDKETGALPDADTILAAQNTLTSTLTEMPGTLQSIASATEGTIYSLTRDLNAISGQISAMGQTLNSASENIGGTVSDVSDLDTKDQLSAKVASCDNYGSVFADLNAGGIAGAMAMENDLDILEDWTQNGDTSMNFQAQVRAVILNCSNSGVVTVRKQNAGGITGWQSLGLIKNSCNLGTVDGTDANYVGGISGMSTGFIRNNYVKSYVCGKTYVGGIAGSAAVVTDCLTQVKLIGAKETAGAILGSREESAAEIENPVFGNRYLSIDEDIGAIDGINYAGIAEPVDLDTFMAIDELPFVFRTVNVRFLFPDGKEKVISVVPGGSLSDRKIPEVPEKDGTVGKWAGLDDSVLTDILFDLTFEAEYGAYIHTVQSSEVRENGRPLVLLEGDFTDAATVSALEIQIPVNEEYEIMESWQITMSELGETIRFLCPSDTDADKVKILVYQNETWEELPFTRDGSYLVIPVTSQQMEIALVKTDNADLLYIGIGAALGIVMMGAILLSKGIKRKAK